MPQAHGRPCLPALLSLCPFCRMSSLSDLSERLSCRQKRFGWAQDWPDHSRLHYEFRRQSPLSYEDKEAAYMEALMTAQSQAALAANLEAILDVEDVDFVFLGPTDLSAAMGKAVPTCNLAR